jgi:hypothetical protein
MSIPFVKKGNHMKRYIVRLDSEEREQLKEMVRKGKVAGYKIRHANMLLMADSDGPAWTDEQIAEGLGASRGQCEWLRRRFVEQGLEACLQRKKQDRPSIEPMFDGEREARLIALACAKPPEGFERWTLRLLSDRAMELQIVPATSYETVRRTLQKTRLSRI